MQKITYDAKAYINENPSVPAINKVQAVDMNEIKTVVNTNADATHTWVELGVKQGSGSITLPNDYKEILVIINLQDNANAWLTLNIPQNLIVNFTGSMGFNSGYYRSASLNAMGRVSVSSTTINLSQAYLNGTDVLSTTYMVVYYR